jgi:hypothetical protein
MRKLKLLILLTFIITNLYVVNAQTYTGVFKTTLENSDYHHFTRSNLIGAAVYINQVSTGPILRLSSGISDPNQGVKFTFENNGNLGLGTNTVTEKLVLYNSDASLVVSQYANLNTGIGSGNAFIVGIESAGNGIVWNRENSYIRFGTNASERMRILSNGNVGIGTTSPSAILHVNGNGKLATFGDGTYNDKYILIRDDEATGIAFGLNDGISINGSSGVALLKSGLNKGFAIATNNSSTFNSVSLANFVIDTQGNVGIGTTSPIYKLSVKGTIGCGEVKVENVTTWADFVFEPDYNLMSLKELETFIQANKHLPEIPTTAEVQENGISVGEMNAKLLQKIEELTLYVIDQNDKMEQFQNELNTLKQENKNLKELIK